MAHIRRSVYLLLALALVGGCSSSPPGPGTSGETESIAPTLAASHAQTPTDGLSATPDTITGTVLETMDAASYTYVRLDTGVESVWIAGSSFPVAVGERLVAELDVPMENFHSQTLNRDFPLIYFVGRVGREGEALAESSVAMPAPNAGPASTAEPQVTEAVERPEGGTAVAEVWANRRALAGTTATVRGRVVKFNANILDRNWVHIQDGTGEASAGTHDLTVTTDAMVSVGDVITVTGSITVDQDFGAGYEYPVLLEAATVSR